MPVSIGTIFNFTGLIQNAFHMPDYNHLRELCQKGSKVSTAVIDEFILYYAAKRDKLDQEFETRISRFRHAELGVPEISTIFFLILPLSFPYNRIIKVANRSLACNALMLLVLSNT